MEKGSLTPEHIGRMVIYENPPKKEEGRITSYNDSFVFVDYDNTGRGQATPYEFLTFTYDKR